MPKSGSDTRTKNSQMSGSEQVLEVAIVDVENAVEVIRLATAAAFGKWRDDRKILLTKTKRLAVQSSKEIPATLDGESVNLGTRAEIDFVSRALTVLVPGK
jgi:diacylglycerol kinase family enzyme